MVIEATPVDYASVLDAVAQPIAVCDIEGEVLFLNALARQFLEVEPGDAMPVFVLSLRETFSQVRIEERGPVTEYFLADVEIRGARRGRASMSLSPIKGDLYRVVLEAVPPAKLEPIFDELDALVAICDSRRTIQLTNAALSRVLGQEEADRLESDLLDLFERGDQSAVRLAASRALAGDIPEEFSARLARGLPAGFEEVRVRVRPLGQGDSGGGSWLKGAPKRGVLMVAQPKLASFSELRRQFARAEELMSLGELATGVAHELKNPLTSILNYAEYLAKKYRDQFSEERDGERLQRIIDGVERIDRFVRELLKLASAERFEAVELDLVQVLKGAVELSGPTLREQGVTMKWEVEQEPLRLLGHEGSLQQVFSNLLLNAARAMPEEGGAIIVRAASEGDRVVVEVEDTARGMAPKTLERIFEPFFSTSTDGQGSGLGLALVRRIVAQHGGEVRATSVPGQGSIFTVSLPT